MSTHYNVVVTFTVPPDPVRLAMVAGAFASTDTDAPKPEKWTPLGMACSWRSPEWEWKGGQERLAYLLGSAGFTGTLSVQDTRHEDYYPPVPIPFAPTDCPLRTALDAGLALSEGYGGDRHWLALLLGVAP